MLRVRVAFTGTTGSPYVATHYFEGSGAVNAASAVAAVGDLWDDLEPIMVNNLTWTVEDEVQELSNAGVVTASFLVAGPTGVGTSTSEMLPAAAQALIQWRTGVYQAGREIRGRTFIPGLPDGTNQDGSVTAATQAVINAAALTYVNSGANPAIWSRTGASVTPIDSGFAWNQFAMLTSRRD